METAFEVMLDQVVYDDDGEELKHFKYGQDIRPANNYHKLNWMHQMLQQVINIDNSVANQGSVEGCLHEAIIFIEDIRDDCDEYDGVVSQSY